MGFRLAVNYRPCGDQENAIAELTRGVREGEQHQVLLGVTGSGKTFTMAKVIEAMGRPALILAHNKTLAAQLYHEFKSFFPDNAVEYFVSYYDYYQPEAYIPSSDVYIEKEATTNDELDKLRLSATKALFERRDCVIVASVRCIYGLGLPERPYRLPKTENHHNRRARQAAALGDQVAVRAARLRHRGQRELHLRPGLARSLLRHAADAGEGAENLAQPNRFQAGRDPLRTQRRRFPPRDVPRARRRHRGLPHLRRRRLSHRAVRRRSGESGDRKSTRL